VRHVRMLGLCLVAVLAVAAYAVSSASALPEWGKCVAKAGGKYTDANCTTKGKGGSFEWEKGATLSPVKFSGHSVGSGGVLTSGFDECESGPDEGLRVPRSQCEAEGGEYYNAVEEGYHVSVECENETNSGEATGKNKLGNVHVTFTGCKMLGHFPCSGKGLASGEIQTDLLKGELGYISKASHEVGVKLEPATKHGHFAEFSCAFGPIDIVVGVGNKKEGAAYSPENKGGNDQIISPITPVNEMTSTYTQVYTVNGRKHSEQIRKKESLAA